MTRAKDDRLAALPDRQQVKEVFQQAAGATTLGIGDFELVPRDTRSGIRHARS
jgi:hypothetical protein